MKDWCRLNIHVSSKWGWKLRLLIGETGSIKDHIPRDINLT